MTTQSTHGQAETLGVETITRSTLVAYVCFEAGTLRESPVTVEGRDPEHAARVAPSKFFGFYFYDLITGVCNDGGERVEIRSEPLYPSKLHLIDAEVLDFEEVVGQLGHGGDLLCLTALACGYVAVVRLRNGELVGYSPDEHELVSTG